MEGLDLSKASCKSKPPNSPGLIGDDLDFSPTKDGDSSSSCNTTPRKNKRKSSEPKKRGSDFSIKRFCPDKPDSPNEIKVEDGEGRYSENPPSTPESSSTPSPPDNFGLRFSSQLNSGLSAVTLPHPLPQAGKSTAVPHHPGFMHPYPLGVPFMPIPSAMMSHMEMVARQQQQQQQQAVAMTSNQQLLGIPGAGIIAPQNKQVGSSNKSAKKTTSSNNNSQSLAREPKQKSKKGNSTNSNSSTSQPLFNLPPPPPPPEASFAEDTYIDDDSPQGSRSRKNYKNMTRERRVEANARERSRVHTISAAFENLRHAVPSYSHNQRLSKLAILRIACTYIMSLASLAGHDYSWNNKPPSFEECVDECTKTIQTEGKAKRRH